MWSMLPSFRLHLQHTLGVEGYILFTGTEFSFKINVEKLNNINVFLVLHVNMLHIDETELLKTGMQTAVHI